MNCKNYIQYSNILQSPIRFFSPKSGKWQESVLTFNFL